MPKKLKFKPRAPEELNWDTQEDIFSRLCAIAVNTVKWSGLPPEIDPRFLELALFGTGTAVFFWEEVVERYVCLTCAYGGPLDIYNIPKYRRAYATNGYQRVLSDRDSVLIYNNYSRRPDFPTLELYAYRLARIMRTVDVNLNAQKTPVVVLASDNTRLSMRNLVDQYDGDQPFIYAYKGFDPESIKALRTEAPFIADRAYMLYQRIWAEALNFLGIETMDRSKMERMTTTEVRQEAGYAMAQRLVRMNARTLAAEQINRMFGLDVQVEFRQDLMEIMQAATQSLDTAEGVERLGEIHDRASMAY